MRLRSMAIVSPSVVLSMAVYTVQFTPSDRFLDQQRIRSVAETTLRSYAYDLLHFLRWWVSVNHTTAITEKTLTEATLLDYIRFQTNQQPQPAAASINRRVGIAERALRLAFPHAQT